MTGALSSLLIAAVFQSGVARVEVQPTAAQVRVGEQLELNARPLTESGSVVSGQTIRWFTADGEYVRVAADGTVTGLKMGRARVVAGVEGAVGTVEVTVLPPPVATLETLSMPASLPSGTSGLWVLRGRSILDGIIANPAVSLTSSDSQVLGVDATGRLHARSPGRVRLRALARDGSAELSATLTVTDGSALRYTLEAPRAPVRAGDVIRFEVAVSGGGVDLSPLWTVNSTGAQITSEGSEGVFVGEAPGEYIVTAMVGESVARSIPVTVEPRNYEAHIEVIGHGAIAAHNSADMWVFEGVDGRDYMYVGTFMYDWMKVFDVTDPASPVLTDSIQFDARRINDVKIHPNARIGIATREMASNRKNGMMLLDLSDPAHPTLLSEYSETVTGGVHNVWIDGDTDLVYSVHNGTRDVHIIDISDPRNPQEVGRWGLDRDRKSLHDVIVQDGYAYLSYWRDGVVTLDVGAGTHGGTPTEPAFVSRYEYPVWNTHTAWRAGQYLIVGDENFPADWDRTGASPIEARGYIHFIDMTDMDNPREVAKYEVPEAGAHNVWVEGDRLYIGYYQAGLRVVDISGELRGDLYKQGREVARFDMRTSDSRVPNWPMAFNAQIHKGFLYASDMNSGVWITRLNEAGRIVF